MLGPMSSNAAKSLLLFAAVAAAAWGAYEVRGRPLASALLVLVCLGLVGFGWLKAGAGKGGADDLQDAGVSTLVFPPESKFHESVLPRR
jgi:hypothetical protein